MGIKGKGYEPKKRNSKQRKRKTIFLFSVEGDNKTEKKYLKKLNSNKVQVHFSQGNATDPEGMFAELQSKKSELQLGEGDKAYCVFDSDFDESKNKHIERVDIEARKKSVDVIVSAPCFELWLLCHFKYSTKQYRTNEEVIKVLKEYIPDYSKSMEGIYEMLLDKQQKAIDNALKLEEYNIQSGKKKHTIDFIPSTEVYKIIEEYNSVMKKN